MQLPNVKNGAASLAVVSSTYGEISRNPSSYTGGFLLVLRPKDERADKGRQSRPKDKMTENTDNIPCNSEYFNAYKNKQIKISY